ncbi:Cpt-6 [Aphelenchoides besseyi]|nr:Cpt-6 [Aphelenchoides besseyi]
MSAKKIQSTHQVARLPRAPFALDARYPTKTQRILEKWEIAFFNKVYPVKPWLFIALIFCSFAYFTLLPSNLPIATTNVYSELLIAAVSALTVALMPVLILRLFLRFFLFSYKGFLFEDQKRPSATTKFWAFCNRIRRICAPPLLNTCNSLLPKLPVPNLQDTIDRYLQSMQPILDKEEFCQLTEMASSFVQNEGPRLQRWAIGYSWLKTNYVTGFWEKYAYLYGRDSVMINSSVAHVDTKKMPDNATQISRAAHLTYVAALNMIAIATEKQRPPAAGLVYAGHYNKLYANTRKPRAQIDEWNIKELARHIVVKANDCYYRVEVFDRTTNRLLQPEELADIFTEVLQRKDTPTEVERKLASLTHDRRDQWSENRRRFFVENENNREFLKTVESSIVVLILDEQTHDAENDQQLSKYMHSMLTHQKAWADKPMNFFVMKNGRCGGLSEHSVADGSELDHLFENFAAIEKHFLKYSKDANDENTIANFQQKPGMQLAERMTIQESKELRTEVERCYDEYEPRMNDLDVASTLFTDFGKGAIKKARVSPDAFIQMAIQLANYRDQGKTHLTYEATSARFYDYSRTETLRSASNESAAFVKAVIDGKSKDECAQLLRNACTSHAHRNKLCMTGQGVDRHLFVLFVLSKGLGIESPLLNHYAAQKWLLSTSQPPTITNQLDEETDEQQQWLGGAFAAVALKGYGICYRCVGNSAIVSHFTSYKSAENTNSERFRTLWKEAMNELLEILS